MKVLSVVGARPQFIKAAPVSRVLHLAGHDEYLVHTGQHYDYGMSQVFFDELGIPAPDINLGIGSGSHGWQTGQMLVGVEKVIEQEQPDWVLVYGDTNSTLAAALVAAKLNLPIAHVEAGLRSFNRKMPEEHNRVLTDHCSDLLFCPTLTAVDNLGKEGISENVFMVGDTMYDAVLQFSDLARRRSTILESLSIKPQEYFLATVHRPYNTDDRNHLHDILAALVEVNVPIVFPVHPRTRQKMIDFGLFDMYPGFRNLQMIAPVGYLDMLVLEENAQVILTDSGGIQKEAFFFRVPCVTMRTETEWVETVESGWNILTGANKTQIVEAVNSFLSAIPHVDEESKNIYGSGDAAEKICDFLWRMR